MTSNNDWRRQRLEMQQDGKLPEKETQPEVPVTIAERGFKSWFTDVFWFHYSRALLIGIAVLAVVAFFVYDIVSRVDDDMTYIVATSGYASEEMLAGFTALCTEVAGDINGDGQMQVTPQILTLDDSSELGVANRQKLALMFVDNEVSLFFWDAATVEEVAGQSDSFVNLSAYGLPTEPGKPWLMRVDTLPVFAEAQWQEPYYAAVQMLQSGSQDNPKTRIPWEKCIEVLQAAVAP